MSSEYQNKTIEEIKINQQLNGETAEEVTAYFTQGDSPTEGVPNNDLGSKENPVASHSIEVITPELLAANGWVKDGFCWISPHKRVSFQFIKIDNELYYHLGLYGDSRNICRTSNAKVVLGFLNGHGLDLLPLDVRPLTYINVIESEGFIAFKDSNIYGRTVNGLFICIDTGLTLDNEVIVKHSQSGNILIVPKNNPAKILQAVKLLEDFAKTE